MDKSQTNIASCLYISQQQENALTNLQDPPPAPSSLGPNLESCSQEIILEGINSSVKLYSDFF